MFTQGEPLDRSAGGLGIGLTLVRKLVEMHGGSWTRAATGRERQRVRRAPACTTWRRRGAARRQRRAPAPCRPLRVLVVDDNIDRGARSAAQATSSRNPVVTTAAARRSRRRRFRPDAVLLDIGMPGIDGYEVARRMRRMPKAARLRSSSPSPAGASATTAPQRGRLRRAPRQADRAARARPCARRAERARPTWGRGTTRKSRTAKSTRCTRLEHGCASACNQSVETTSVSERSTVSLPAQAEPSSCARAPDRQRRHRRMVEPLCRAPRPSARLRLVLGVSGFRSTTSTMPPCSRVGAL